MTNDQPTQTKLSCTELSQVLDAIRRLSNTNKPFCLDTILFDNVTLEKAEPQIKELANKGIITQKQKFEPSGGWQYTFEIHEFQAAAFNRGHHD